MNRIWLACLVIGLYPPAGRTFGREEQPDLSSLLSKALYERMFPHHHPIYTYDALLRAASAFPAFAGEGDATVRRRELAAFLGEIAHETNNGGPGSEGGPYAWGLYYTEEIGCQDGHCTEYNVGNGGPYLPVPGKTYYGRGPIQLSYPYNYGQAGADLGLPLLQHPELVSHDGVIAFKTAIWFWMRSSSAEPSCHEVMTGKWQPSAQDRTMGRRPGFGMTINIINGNVECRSGTTAAREDREDRIGHYRHFAGMLSVPVEKDCDCVGMTPYGH
ncbi:MAG TPA: chitinase [Puia sp.]|nr:chitinase [Puia sp.]